METSLIRDCVRTRLSLADKLPQELRAQIKFNVVDTVQQNEAIREMAISCIVTMNPDFRSNMAGTLSIRMKTDLCVGRNSSLTDVINRFKNIHTVNLNF